MTTRRIALSTTKGALYLLALSALLAVAGCVEDKALALQSAAVQYRDQAVRALTLTAGGVTSATAMPAATADQLTGKLKAMSQPINAKTLDFLLACAATQPLEEYSRYQAKLLMIGIITTGQDLKNTQRLKKDVDKAADKMSMLAAIGMLVSFIVVRV